MLVLTFLVTACNALSVFLPPAQDKQTGDISNVSLNEDGHFEVTWEVNDKASNPASETYEIYMLAREDLPQSMARLALAGSSLNSVATFTSVKTEWAVDLKSSGQRVGQTTGVTHFTYTGSIDPKLNYFFQIFPKSTPSKVKTKGALVQINLKSPAVSQVSSGEEGFILTWPVVVGATQYNFYNSDDLDTILFSSPIASISIRYDSEYDLSKLCIRSERGELLSSSCRSISDDLKALPVKSIELPGAYSTTKDFVISWTDWKNAAASYSFKTCSNAACSISCSAEQDFSKGSIQYSGAEASSFYACVKSLDKAGNGSEWKASQHSIIIDTIAPTITAIPDQITRTALTVAVSTSGATSWQWSQISGPASATIINADKEDATFTLPTDGIYRMRLVAKDDAGNTTQAEFNLTMDTTAPVFAGIGELWRKSSTSVWVFWTAATDALTASSDIVYEICINTVAGTCQANFTANYTMPKHTWNYEITGLTPGANYEFLVRARDRAGNTNIGSAAVSLSEWTDILQFAAGQEHNCVIIGTARNVKCWGYNSKGQLGNGSTLDSNSPQLVPGLSAVTMIEAGDLHTCALLSNSTVKCWGSNNKGQIGDGTTTDRTSPVAVSGLTGATTLALGIAHSCAMIGAGASVQCWGSNASRTIGDGTTTDRYVPTVAAGVTGISKLAAAGNFNCAIVTTGNLLRCWGSNASGQLGDTSTTNRSSWVAVSGLGAVAEVSLGVAHSCARLIADNTIRCWGKNSNGQLGDGSLTNRTAPITPALAAVSSIVLGDNHSCAIIASDSSVKCWGYNNKGQLGDGTRLDQSSPVTAANLAGISSLALGGSHSCAFYTTDNSFKCWGNNWHGQIVGGANWLQATPVSPVGLAAVTKVVMGDHFSCAILAADASVKCWGYNPKGQLGDGTQTYQSTPVSVVGLSGVSSLSLGFHHSCAVLAADGSVKCWGENGYGQIGDGTTTNRLAPTTVTGLGPALSVSLGDFHSCAVLRADNTVRCWGTNGSGELADGTTTHRYTPVVALGLPAVDVVVSGTFHSCAIVKSDRSVMCWGDNGHGDIGDGTTTHRLTAVPVPGITGVYDLSLGIFHTCVSLAVDGSVKCWGMNGAGQLGDGTTTQQNSPVVAQGVSGATLISAGLDSTCALVGADKHLICWGTNMSGELGDGTTTARTGPVEVKGLSGVTSFGIGRFSTCAALTDQSVRCWGKNYHGDLGMDGRSYESDVPLLKQSVFR